MEATQVEEKNEQSGRTSFVRRSFTSSTTPIADPEAASAERDEAVPHAPTRFMSRRAVIGGTGMAAAALVCLVLAAGLPSGKRQSSGAAAAQAPALQERIRAAQTREQSLPSAKDAERALVLAQTDAASVAQLQNDYRHLTPGVAAADGRLDTARVDDLRRNLVPYFATSTPSSALGPWYLLAGDKDVFTGIGIPLGFDSGFRWIAQRPYLIDVDGRVRVTWLAIEAHPAPDQTPAVLAWGSADYDVRRKVFVDLRTGTTATGEALRLEVRG